jgi:hypothetical protein
MLVWDEWLRRCSFAPPDQQNESGLMIFAELAALHPCGHRFYSKNIKGFITA